MELLIKVLFVAIGAVALSCVCAKNEKSSVRKFPEGFLLGASTASYQIEGAWNEDGKSESIWDRLSHTTPCVIQECHTGDVADDSYHNVQRDVEMMRELGLDFYRFSLSWTRILPTSFPDQINEAGVAYYNNLINEMLKYNIEPMVTIYHWDLPQKLQDMGGWVNPYIVDWYTDYARVVFQLFGDRVKKWITINEPEVVCQHGYGTGGAAPMYTMSGVADYICSKNLLLSHAKAWHMYNNEFRASQGGQCGISLNMLYYEAESEEHQEAADDDTQFSWGMYGHSIFTEEGNYPKVIRERVAAKSAEQGFPRSRLPEFTNEEIELIRGTADFLGVNHYSTQFSYRNDSVNGIYPVPSLSDDLSVGNYVNADWAKAATSWLAKYPEGFYKILMKVRDMYNNPIIYVTENGWSTRGGLEDDDRVQYYREYLNAMLDAIEDGCDIRMYSAWSLMDNFEWMQGFTERFGLYEVDYDSPARPRTPRSTALYYAKILRTRTLDPHYKPDSCCEHTQRTLISLSKQNINKNLGNIILLLSFSYTVNYAYLQLTKAKLICS